MEIEFFGANCFRIKTKNVTLVIDDNLAKIGKKTIQNDKTVSLYTAEYLIDANASKLSRLQITSPGEYEVGDVTVNGIQARAHMDDENTRSATVFQFLHHNVTVTVLGHVHPDISEDVIELISGTDVLIVPVGGNGYTLDAVGATSMIKRIEPDIVIPSQYDYDGLNYEVPAQTLEEFGKVSSLSLDDVQDSLKVATAADDSGQSRVVVLKVK